MLYEFRYEINGRESSCTLRGTAGADTDRLFRDWWSEYGDPLPAFWLVGCWSER